MLGLNTVPSKDCKGQPHDRVFVLADTAVLAVFLAKGRLRRLDVERFSGRVYIPPQILPQRNKPLLLPPNTTINPYVAVVVPPPETHFITDHVLFETEAPPSYVFDRKLARMSQLPLAYVQAAYKNLKLHFSVFSTTQTHFCSKRT